MGVLDMQPAQDAMARIGLVVLHQTRGDASGGVAFLLPAFEEIATLVAKDPGFDDEDARDVGLADLHGSVERSKRPRRYSP